ncbi:methenyltetrahydrofolate cyclohydrolase [Lasius niger]|uniref:Methenyltetrahydrofolate cyclohydrolase n=1 Tax=Lasius niger TaxID=67767 RepID=A0A0J7KVY7_LASNI|nr:methenyltetrahydrofolate cyclohydrolase [Lasius niger]
MTRERDADSLREEARTEGDESDEVRCDASNVEMIESSVVGRLHEIPVDLPQVKPALRTSSDLMDSYSRLKYMPVTKKGLRHIKRIFGVLRGESRMFSAPGHLEDRPVRVLFDMKEDFDVVTTAAVTYSTGVRMQLDYVEDPQNIPAYLKAQKYVQVHAVNCRVAIKGRSMKIQPMLLRGEEPLVLLSRHSSTAFLLHISRRPGTKLSRSVLLSKGKQLIQRWTEASPRDKSRAPARDRSTPTRTNNESRARRESPRSEVTAGRREEPEEPDDSDRENAAPHGNAAVRKRSAASSGGYFSSAQ